MGRGITSWLRCWSAVAVIELPSNEVPDRRRGRAVVRQAHTVDVGEGTGVPQKTV